MIAAACLFGLAPWVGPIAARLDLASWVGQRQTRSADGGLASLIGVRRSPITSAGAATIIAAVTVVIAALVVIINGLASAPASGLALVIAGGAAVLVVAVRILMLVGRTASRCGCGGRRATACAISPTGPATWC